jgi:hypothetical protein
MDVADVVGVSSNMMYVVE